VTEEFTTLIPTFNNLNKLCWA